MKINFNKVDLIILIKQSKIINGFNNKMLKNSTLFTLLKKKANI